MRRMLSPRRLVPIAISAVIVVLALRFLTSATHGLHVADVVRALQAIPLTSVAIGALLVIVLYSALATYETIIARYVGGPVSSRRAAMGGVLAASIGHALGLGTVSGGAIRYRVYAAAGLRPLGVGKMVLLAAIPYPAALGLLLSVSLLVQSEAAAPILHTTTELARGIGLALLVLHVAYVTLVLKRREPLSFGRYLVTLPPPNLTGVQYCVGIIEVCAAASILYVLLPAQAGLPFSVFIGVYVLSILAGLASSVPAGFGVFDATLIGLLPHAPQAELWAAVIVYRVLLELLPLVTASLVFAAYEIWWRLPSQRARVAEIRLAQRQRDD
ncbi:MAG: YbhN family protein [Proteobacteria bacterium]|nr:YbhN family protein [Pseudomonadota bacterium]